MLKQKVVLEHLIEDRIYQFECPNNAPLGEIHDSLFRFLDFVDMKIEEARKLKEQPPEEKKE